MQSKSGGTGESFNWSFVTDELLANTNIILSGGINLNTISDYAKCGVDYISVGALTHQINSLDLSLKADF